MNLVIENNNKKLCILKKKSKIKINNSYDTWEFNYFSNLLDLRDILIKCLEKLNVNSVDTKSANFMYIFSDFIRQYSSGEISSNLEEMEKRTEKIYNEYIIKRDKI